MAHPPSPENQDNDPIDNNSVAQYSLDQYLKIQNAAEELRRIGRSAVAVYREMSVDIIDQLNPDTKATLIKVSNELQNQAVYKAINNTPPQVSEEFNLKLLEIGVFAANGQIPIEGELRGTVLYLRQILNPDDHFSGKVITKEQ